MKRELPLWTAFFAGPLVWLPSFGARWPLSGWVCAFHWKPALLVIATLSVIVVGSAGMLAWTEWQRVEREMPGEGRGRDPAVPHAGHDGVGAVRFLDRADRLSGDSGNYARGPRMKRAAALLLLPLAAAWTHEGEPLETHDLWGAGTPAGLLRDRRRPAARLGGNLQVRLRVVPYDRRHLERARTGRPAGIGARMYVAGVLQNAPENIARWIQNPKAVDEKTAMPTLGVSSRTPPISPHTFTQPSRRKTTS